jgi:hypothetical protein
MIGDVRAHLAAVLAGLGVPVHLYASTIVVPPAAVLFPASPYWAPTLLKGSAVGLVVRLYVPIAPNSGADQALDELIDGAVTALTAAGVRVDPVPAPTVQSDGGALVAELTTFTSWEDS